MTLQQLTDLLLQHGAKAFVVQFYEGRWRASVRRSDGISPIVEGDSMLEAISECVKRLGIAR